MNGIYFDNAATSFPKPESVAVSVVNYINNIGANPGRSANRRSIEASDIVFECRELLAEKFGLKDPLRAIFTLNATDALNTAILGSISPGDHVITGGMEHNSTMRPLNSLESRGIIELSVIEKRQISTEDLMAVIKHNSKVFILNHASNVTGDVQKTTDLFNLCRKKKIITILDAAQSAGTINIDMHKDNIDILATSGHKGLYGPAGTGAMLINDSYDYETFVPLKTGGTGSSSESFSQPVFLPDRFESGTLNVPGIAGIAAGLQYLKDNFSKDDIITHKNRLREMFLDGCSTIEGFTSYRSGTINTGVVSFNIDGIEPSRLSMLLGDEYEISGRPGLQCAPAAHIRLGTFPAGTMRFSFGLFNTNDEVERAVTAIKKIAKSIR